VRKTQVLVVGGAVIQLVATKFSSFGRDFGSRRRPRRAPNAETVAPIEHGQNGDIMDRLLTTNEVAELMRLAPETLRYWRWKGMGPKSFRLGSRVVYRETDVIMWIEEQARV
jgi:predicted DNA-binding transcriptional regulator AlpA